MKTLSVILCSLLIACAARAGVTTGPIAGGFISPSILSLTNNPNPDNYKGFRFILTTNNSGLGDFRIEKWSDDLQEWNIAFHMYDQGDGNLAGNFSGPFRVDILTAAGITNFGPLIITNFAGDATAVINTDGSGYLADGGVSWDMSASFSASSLVADSISAASDFFLNGAFWSQMFLQTHSITNPPLYLQMVDASTNSVNLGVGNAFDNFHVGVQNIKRVDTNTAFTVTLYPPPGCAIEGLDSLVMPPLSAQTFVPFITATSTNLVSTADSAGRGARWTFYRMDSVGQQKGWYPLCLAVGTNTLSSGSATISNTNIGTGTLMLTYRSRNGTINSVGEDFTKRTNGVSFTVKSSSAGDTNDVEWAILPPNS